MQHEQATPDALPASQLPRALWEAGARPSGVFSNPLTDGRLDEGEPGEWWRPWEPHKKIAHTWGVLAWARAQGWDTEVEWIGGHGEVRITVDGHRTITQWQAPTEAAECEAICRAVLLAVQGWATP